MPEPLSELGVSFPLTPALSLGEREHRSTARANPNGLRFADRLAKMPPLPEGEGWGEGELGSRRFRRLRTSEASLWRSFWLQRHIRKQVF